MFAIYFGLPSPIIHSMQIVGVRFHVPTGAHYTCDAHGGRSRARRLLMGSTSIRPAPPSASSVALFLIVA
eukprot:7023039-Prymnesium_polylepis.1